jgi:hypothetical protein
MVTGKTQCQCHMMTCFDINFFHLSEANVQRLKYAETAITVIVISSVSPRVVRPTHRHGIFFSCYGKHVYFFFSFKSFLCLIIHRVATSYRVTIYCLLSRRTISLATSSHRYIPPLPTL